MNLDNIIFDMNTFSFKSLIFLEVLLILIVIIIELFLLGDFTIFSLIIALPIIVMLFIHKQKLSMKSLFYSFGLLFVTTVLSRISQYLYENYPYSSVSNILDIFESLLIFDIFSGIALLSIFIILIVNRQALTLISLIIPVVYVVLCEMLKYSDSQIAEYISSFELFALLAALLILFCKVTSLSLQSLLICLSIPVSLAIVYGILSVNHSFGLSMLLPMLVLGIIVVIFVTHYTLAFVFRFWLRMFKKLPVSFGEVNSVAARYALLTSVYAVYFITAFYWVIFGLEVMQPYDLQGAVYLVPILIMFCSLFVMMRKLFLDTYRSTASVN